ncbi:MAG TPA: penicillin-binding transpeptidase domain-containing protein, partial [Geobacterales bacterium]|nr:penicillin-binding transpeptidase domain-containing protein [Geobacterales bacterium]
YLNQVPYAANRRGVAAAARYYFDRDLTTLSSAEMLTLAVLVRAPGRLDLKRGGEGAQRRVAQLALRLREQGVIDEREYKSILADPLQLAEPKLPVAAGHFIRYLQGRGIPQQLISQGRVATTLDAPLQRQLQNLLDGRLRDLNRRGVTDGAVLVADLESGQILAWVNGGGDDGTRAGGCIDKVLVPRQPGSTLKPLLYAEALEQGWTPATIIDDSPLSGRVGSGQHTFRNYSRRFYGPLRLRDCLANSLNVPAVRAVTFIGYDRFLTKLHQLGFSSLTREADFYGEGLALGNGEVTLYELVQAYATLGRGGLFRPLQSVVGEGGGESTVFSPESASLIADILSDSDARRLEFGRGGVLELPQQTAVKTGTSTDYRDAWAVGFDHRYVVGVWMGELDQRPTAGVTGAAGPALLLRTIFAELNRFDEGGALYLSPRLLRARICQESGERATDACPSRQEWFAPGTVPVTTCRKHAQNEVRAESRGAAHLEQPTAGLMLAMDPRIPDDMEAFPLQLAKEAEYERVEWLVDGVVVGSGRAGERRFLWRLVKGEHRAQARLWRGGEAQLTEEVPFVVR